MKSIEMLSLTLDYVAKQLHNHNKHLSFYGRFEIDAAKPTLKMSIHVCSGQGGITLDIQRLAQECGSYVERDKENEEIYFNFKGIRIFTLAD